MGTKPPLLEVLISMGLLSNLLFVMWYVDVGSSKCLLPLLPSKLLLAIVEEFWNARLTRLPSFPIHKTIWVGCSNWSIPMPLPS